MGFVKVKLWSGDESKPMLVRVRDIETVTELKEGGCMLTYSGRTIRVEDSFDDLSKRLVETERLYSSKVIEVR